MATRSYVPPPPPPLPPARGASPPAGGPEGPAAATDDDALEGWVSYQAKDTGTYFFYNTRSRVTATVLPPHIASIMAMGGPDLGGRGGGGSGGGGAGAVPAGSAASASQIEGVVAGPGGSAADDPRETAAQPQMRFANPLMARYTAPVDPMTGVPGLLELVGYPISLKRWRTGDGGCACGKVIFQADAQYTLTCRSAAACRQQPQQLARAARRRSRVLSGLLR